MHFSLMTLILVSTLTLFSCSRNKDGDNKSQYSRFTWSFQSEDQAVIRVFNQYGEPVEQAQILIGMAQGNPFPENFLRTDRTGVAIVPTDWINPQHVTIDAPGYIRETLLNQNPGNITVRLNSIYLSQRAEIRGTVTQLPIVNGDKLIDFALVMPVMTRSDLLNFDINSIISPYSDILTVAGQNLPVPSNVSLPTQKENYFFNLTISKPEYRMLSTTLGPKRIYAIRGQFPFKTVVNELREGKQFYELLNHFSIQGGGIRDITLVNPTTRLDLPGNELVFKNTIKVQPAASSEQEVMMIVAVSEVANTLIPTDIKRAIGTESLSLASLGGKPVYVVSALKRAHEFMATTPGSDRISAGLVPYSSNVKTTLLPLVENPSISNKGYQINFPRMPNKSGINPIAVTAAISDLVEVPNGENKIINVNRRWEITGLGWTDKLHLPQWPLADSQKKRRVEINFIGSTTHSSVNLDDELINAATHVSHASTDY